MIPYNKPCVVGKESEYIHQAIQAGKLSGDGPFTKRCHEWFRTQMGLEHSLLTTSASSALDMAGMLLDLQPGDEVIMPSFNFVSAANSFATRGASIRFVDIRPDTMNIDEERIEAAITTKTKAIVVVHYAGVSCEMDRISEIAQSKKIVVIEDAAQAIASKYKDKFLGSIGDMACFSFHETKNLTSGGEGGLFIARSKPHTERAEVIREKGTNRNQFLKGTVDKYTWVDIGSSFLPSEINAAYLFANLEKANQIIDRRLTQWNHYQNKLRPLAEKESIQISSVPSHCQHNGHIFFIKLRSEKDRDRFISFMKDRGISTPFHYIPLHTAPAGMKYGKFVGADRFTTIESSKLARLPLYDSLSIEDQNKVLESIYDFFS